MSQMIESFMQTAGKQRTRALALEELEAAPAGESLLSDPHPLHGLRVELQVRLGSASMTLGELLAARQNEVLRLDRAVGEPVDLLLEGRTVARGELVAVDDHFAVRITELPQPLKL